jgi:nitrate reductase (cytochrome), electron transfer subunit
MQSSNSTDSNAPVPHDIDRNAPNPLRRYITLIVVLGLGIALGGYLKGIQEPQPISQPARPSLVTIEGIPAAVSYSELPNATLKPNSGWTSELGQLKFSKPGVFEPVIRTDEMKMQALLDRSKNRAYDSAPPVIPHGIQQMTTSNCLACHNDGIKVGDRVATKISHPVYTNCTQCHVEDTRTEINTVSPILTENDFQGTKRAGAGARAWLGAPPTIPHTTWMRQDCTSCHGLVARPGIRTTHPWLSNCIQCHAPSAALDQAAFGRD